MNKGIGQYGKFKIGDRFGRLTIIDAGFPEKRKKWGWRYFFLCRCDCGNTKKICTDYFGVQVWSCGCLRKELKNKPKSHGMCRTKLYQIWNNMKMRCYTKKNRDYHYWGGRGITVCDEWRNSFKAFYDWSIEAGWKDGLIFDRIENDNGYYPQNCRYVTPLESTLNRRNTVYIEYDGEKKCLKDWAKKIGIHPKTLSFRLKKKIPLNIALTQKTIRKSAKK